MITATFFKISNICLKHQYSRILILIFKLKSVKDTLKPTAQRGKLLNKVQITTLHKKGFSLFISKRNYTMELSHSPLRILDPLISLIALT